jgi:hypothetical protein
MVAFRREGLLRIPDGQSASVAAHVAATSFAATIASRHRHWLSHLL